MWFQLRAIFCLSQDFSLMDILTCLWLFFIDRIVIGMEPNVFSVTDDTPSGHRLGHVTHPNRLKPYSMNSDDRWKCLLVRASRPPATYFSVDENTCDIYTKVVMDRESLCVSKPKVHKYGIKESLQQSLHTTSNGKSWTNDELLSECEFTFQVSLQRYFGTSVSSSSLPEFVDIHVMVIDRNDHVPSFQPHKIINVSIPEAAPIGTRINLPLAYDPDSPEFSIKRYQLYPKESAEWALYQQTEDIIFIGNLYQIVVGLFLELRTNVDRERKDSYTVEVRAFDFQDDFSFLEPDDRNLLRIHVLVEDVNDNGPVFRPASEDDTIDLTTGALTNMLVHDMVVYKADVIENSWSKSPILRLKTYDPDSAIYASVRYDFAPYVDTSVRHLFKLNEHTGELYLRYPIDYETSASFSFHVIATDSEYERRWKNDGVRPDSPSAMRQPDIYTATAQVIIHVRDINDEPPIIEVDYLRLDKATGRPATFAEVQENLEPPQFIADILVTDRDANPVNNHVSCDALPVTDRKSSAHEIVFPQTNEVYFQLTEMRRQPGRVQYNLLTVQPLDRERVPFDSSMLRIRVSCADSGSPSKTSSTVVSVHVTDVNDNDPIIEISRAFGGSSWSRATERTNNTVELRENSPIGTLVARINVTDRDPGMNGKIVCSFATSPNSADLTLIEHFHIDPISCEVVTRKSIDREAINAQNNKIILPILAADQGSPARTAQAELQVVILDENDNPPTLPQSYYRLSVKENSPAGTSVGRLEIVDNDEAIDQINLRFQKHENLPFQLWPEKLTNVVQTNPHSDGGSSSMVIFHINTTRPLDREDRESYEFKVLVIDRFEAVHNHVHTTTATVFVSVEDENDNDPVVIFPQQANKTFYLSNVERKHYQLMTVNANDRDSSNVQFTFSLVQEFENTASQISSQTQTKVSNASNTTIGPPTFLDIDQKLGTVYLIRDMTINDSGLHAFHVVVKDADNNPRSTSLRFLVQVESAQSKSGQPYPITDTDMYIHGEGGVYSASVVSPDSANSVAGQIYQSTYNKDSVEFIGTRSELRRSPQRPPLLRFTGDMVLVLALGMILLLLLATMCLVVYARRWTAASAGRSTLNTQSMGGRQWLSPSFWNRQQSNTTVCEINKEIPEATSGGSHPTFWMQKAEGLDSSVQSYQGSEKAEILNSQNNLLENLDAATLHSIRNGEQLCYHECRKFNLLSDTNKYSEQVSRPPLNDEYTPLQSLTRLHTCKSPETGTFIHKIDSKLNTDDIVAWSTDLRNVWTKVHNPTSKDSRTSVFTSPAANPSSLTKPSRIKSFNNVQEANSVTSMDVGKTSKRTPTEVCFKDKQEHDTKDHELC